MTNWDKWQLYFRDIPSPQAYIDFGFYYTVAAFLQRRVWAGPNHQKLYPNIYPILVGEPGIGKGLVIKQVLEFLREHTIDDPAKKIAEAQVDAENLSETAVNLANFSNADKPRNNGKFKPEKHLVIPMAANATTFEALVAAIARAGRFKVYKEWDEKLEKKTDKIYTHCSLCFCLEEISSLFRKHQENVINFLITAYDCGDYEYDTKTQGTDYVKRCCLNFFGGTTPTFVESAFNDRLLNDGFVSRIWPIYADKNRVRPLRAPELTAEQKQARAELSEHFKKLSNLYGPIQFAPDAWQWMEDWWKKHQEGQRANHSPKLVSYYSRRNIHIQKLAMAKHFGEHAEHEDFYPAGTISLKTVISAHEELAEIEKTMHYALEFEGNNPLARVAKKMLGYIIKNGAQSTDDLLIEFYNDADQAQQTEVLDYLRRTGKITLVDGAVPKWVAVTKVKE